MSEHSAAFKARTWSEQKIRDRIIRVGGSSSTIYASVDELGFLVDEIDRLRDHLRRIRIIADDKVQQQIPGWGSWQTVQRLIKEVLE